MVVKYPMKSGEWSVPLRSDELFSYYVNSERTPGTGKPRWCQPGNTEQIPGEELSGGSKYSIQISEENIFLQQNKANIR